MQQLHFHRASSVGDALETIQRSPDARFLAGGQSLIPLMKLDLAQPTRLVAVADLEELRQIKIDGSELVIGAAVTHAEVTRSDQVRAELPALAELAGRIGDAQVRNRGTLGGSIAHADPAADYPAALLGSGATVQTDRRAVPADAFFRGLYETALEPGELITAVRFPRGGAAAYAKFPQPASKFALVGVWVHRSDDGVRVAVTGAAARVFRATALEGALDADFRATALSGVEIPTEDLLDNFDASAEYRAHLIRIMAQRAVEAC